MEKLGDNYAGGSSYAGFGRLLKQHLNLLAGVVRLGEFDWFSEADGFRDRLLLKFGLDASVSRSVVFARSRESHFRR